MDKSAERLESLRDAFKAKRGYWSDDWQFILEHDPDFFEGYLNLSSYAWERGTLSPKVREFLYIVTVAAVTHIFPPGLHQHMRNAIGHGATEDELLTVLEIAATVGVQTFLLGVRSIEAAKPQASRGHGGDQERAALLARHENVMRGPADPDIHDAIQADPAFYERWQTFASVPFSKPAVIEPKVAHMLAFTAYASVTQQCLGGAKQHAVAALEAGATARELLEALELTTGMSIHSVTIGLPILLEELNRAA